MLFYQLGLAFAKLLFHLFDLLLFFYSGFSQFSFFCQLLFPYRVEEFVLFLQILQTQFSAFKLYFHVFEFSFDQSFVAEQFLSLLRVFIVLELNLFGEEVNFFFQLLDLNFVQFELFVFGVEKLVSLFFDCCELAVQSFNLVSVCLELFFG